MTKRVLVGLLGSLVLTGCGYRAPLFASYVPEVTDTTESSVAARFQPLAALVEKDTGFEPTEGNTVTLFPDASQKWDLLKEDLEYAETSIYIDHYRFCPDAAGAVVEGILRDKAREDVDVRLILDKGGHSRKRIQELYTLLPEGVKLSLFRKPVWFIDQVWPSRGTHRDHRKLVLLDGQTAYVGGRNIQDTDARDADLRITGPAVEDLSAVYMENQRRVAPLLSPVYVEKDLDKAARMDNIPEMKQFTDVMVQVVPESPTDEVLPIRNCFEWTLAHAQKYFWFYNPYTPPPGSTLQALKDAAARGVDVRWIVPAVNGVKPEKWMGESLYRELLEAGVHIYEWQDQMLCTRQFLADDYLLALGSASMDNLSFFLNYELMALVYDENMTRYASYLFLSDLETHCREISLEEVLGWGAFRKLRNWLTRTLAGPVG